VKEPAVSLLPMARWRVSPPLVVKFAVPFRDVNFVVKLFFSIFHVSLLPIFLMC